jgi:hypothetical protein
MYFIPAVSRNTGDSLRYKCIRLMSVLLCKLETEDSPVLTKNISSLSSAKHTFRVSHDENNVPICNYVL